MDQKKIDQIQKQLWRKGCCSQLIQAYRLQVAGVWHGIRSPTSETHPDIACDMKSDHHN
jgi:hypothetical protein